MLTQNMYQELNLTKDKYHTSAVKYDVVFDFPIFVQLRAFWKLDLIRKPYKYYNYI